MRLFLDELVKCKYRPRLALEAVILLKSENFQLEAESWLGVVVGVVVVGISERAREAYLQTKQVPAAACPTLLFQRMPIPPFSTSMPLFAAFLPFLANDRQPSQPLLMSPGYYPTSAESGCVLTETRCQ